jgi:hypothetical protein
VPPLIAGEDGDGTSELVGMLNIPIIPFGIILSFGISVSSDIFRPETEIQGRL